MTASAIGQNAKVLIVGIAGITVLYHSAKAVTLLASIVGKVLASTEDYFRKTDHMKLRDKDDENWRVEDVMPVKHKTWSAISFDALKTVLFATVSMYLINRFLPYIVADANSLLHCAVPIQFTPHHIPLTRFAGI